MTTVDWAMAESLTLGVTRLIAQDPNHPLYQESREAMFLRFLIDQGGRRRYGTDDWRTEVRDERIREELRVIEKVGFVAGLIMLADVLAFCRREGIITGPGRGSVGGCYVAFLVGVHEMDSIERGLMFERFLNEDRVSYPDVDIDVSQKHRQRVIDYIRTEYSRSGQVVLQVPAFSRLGGRGVVDAMAAARRHEDPNADATAIQLKRCFPDKGSITGGVKADRELDFWLEGKGGHGDTKKFRAIAEQAGWLDYMLKIDSLNTNLARHAAGIVILRTEDLATMPQTSTDGVEFMAGYDMHALDSLGYLKWDILGLRTMDVIADADRMTGGDGSIDHLMQLWREHKDDPRPYQLLSEARTLGIFQMETPGFAKLLRDFQPEHYDHLVQLGALYRPGALDYKRESDGLNMVQVFVRRRHGEEQIERIHPDVDGILANTFGVMLYQEQQMAVAREFAGFNLKQADALRKAIGKKKPEEMAKLIPLWEAGTGDKPEAVRNRVWKNIEAAARYSWNLSHSDEYGLITWWTAFFKALPEKAAGFYCSLLNSYEEDKQRMADAIGEARQTVEVRPPDINVAMEDFVVDDGAIVFGLNGLKGMGEANRSAILVERMIGGPFTSYEQFCQRLPSLPMNLKTGLVAAGAFNRLDAREHLLARIPKGKGETKWLITFACGCTNKIPGAISETELRERTCKKKAHPGSAGVSQEEQTEVERWTVAEHLNHNRNLKNPRPLPTDLALYEIPSDTELAAGEMEAMGFYISAEPLADVTRALSYHGSNVFGGEVQKVWVKPDRNGNPTGHFMILTPELDKKKVIMFSSFWTTFAGLIQPGERLLFTGEDDGGSALARAAWKPGDVRHIRHVKLEKDGSYQSIKIGPDAGNLTMARVHEWERSGYHVRLL